MKDAEKVVEIKPDWPKGYSRLGAALHGLHKWDDAVAAYQKGLELDPSNAQLKQGLADAEAAQHRASSSKGPSGGGLFANPQVLGRLATNPQTRPFLQQPDFMAMLHDINTHPDHMQKYLADERFQIALNVGLGLQVNPGENGENGGDTPMEVDSNQPTAKKNEPAASGKPEAPPKEPEPELSEEEKAKKAQHDEALKEKEAGNACYKKKEFEAAIEHYNKAIELDDTDISFLTNRAAVKYEMADFDGAIQDCEKAVERGREVRADYKLVARAMTRKGNALVKQGKLQEAIEVYNRSLTEHRNADTLKRLQDTEKALKEKQEQEYVNLELSAEEKDKGNEAFKAQKYPEAVQHYTEAIKRGPPSVNEEAYKLYSNRAACYTKLAALSDAMKDADECIRLKPDFPKGYSRKGHVQFFMKEYDNAMETYEAGLKYDPENQELKDGLMRCIQAINKMNRGEMTEEEMEQRRERGMADPEVQRILKDPVIMNVLREMQENPASAQQHLKHPDIAKKVEKLVAAGILQIR